ncbi:hypothetical protein C1I98_04580 [Spongiactinospora gelatinilytica]|uniref:Uncharacterized protein n=1 Tax=Spongiactinospora gelatinilytica TaxID=2666298 RepID=A0A2W2GX55_9ACTN|nr:hypothetical protein [Spongiactinospora gelatinilytica]PZG54276.1 hypothetical protein C1I98_04580 [Spongiactinospora gelatinilytica]
MSSSSLSTAGVLLITVPAVAFGGMSLLAHLTRNIPGYLDNPTRRSLWRAGHAHAGVLVAMLYVDQADLSDGMRTLVRVLIAAAPILMPPGFFLSVARPRDTKPNGLLWLTVAGGAGLGVGALTLGVGLL